MLELAMSATEVGPWVADHLKVDASLEAVQDP
jgi:hypothetical protein